SDGRAPFNFAEHLREDLRLVLQTAERGAMDDAIAVALERGAGLLGALFALASLRLGRKRRVRCKDLALDTFRFFADRGSQRQLPAHMGPRSSIRARADNYVRACRTQKEGASG